MSLSGPNTLFVIGDTDQWDLSVPVSERNPELIVDSRMRNVRRSGVSSLTGVVRSRLARVPTVGGVYAELAFISGSQNRFGLIDASAAGSITPASALGLFVGSISVVGNAVNASITLDGVVVQTGLGPVGTPNRIGVLFYLVGTQARVQFYRDELPLGAPEDVSWTSAFLGFGTTSSTGEGWLCIDRDDLPWYPIGSQPWGAAARVADSGGYSPAGSEWDPSATSGDIALDAFRMKITNALPNNRSSYGTRGRSTGTALWLEVQIEVGSALIGGLAPASDVSLSSYPGSTAASYGYSCSAGRKYNNGAFTALGVTLTTTDVLCILWRPGIGIWFFKNGVVIEGNPEAGTGASYATPAGITLYPVCSVSNAAVARLCTHARNQRYRPGYAEAWDGADLLPDQHFAGHLLSETEMTQAIAYAMPWNSSRSGLPIGNIELANDGKRYHALHAFELRDEDLAAYDIVDGLAAHAGRANVDHVLCNGSQSVTVVTRGRDSRMDRRVDSPAIGFGICDVVGAVPSETASLAFTIAQDPYFTVGDVTDNGGLSVDFGRGLVGTNGIVRLINPVGRHAGLSFLKYNRTGETTPTNGDFTTWAAGLPTGWTVTHTPPNSLLSQSGSAARFQRLFGAPICRISQAVSCQFVQIEVSAYVSGDLLVGSAQNIAGIRSVGTYIVPGTMMLTAIEGTDLTVTAVRAITATNQATGADCMRYLMETLGGFASNEWTFDNVLITQIGNLGYWSDKKPSYREILDEMCLGMVWSYYTDTAGVVRIVPFAKPGTPVGRITRAAIMSEVDIRHDLATALTYACVIAARNYAQHAPNEIIPGASGAIRLQLLNVGFIDRFYDLHPFYQASVGKEIHLSPTLADGVFPIGQRLEDAYEVRRTFYDMDVRLDDIRGFRPGQTLTVEHDAAEAPAESDLVLVSVARRTRSAVVRCTFWG